MRTVYGIVCDELGHASKEILEQSPTRPEVRKAYWATASGDVLRVQNEKIPVDRDHDHRWVGEVIYLERRNGSLWAVAHVDDHVTPAVNVRVGERSVAVEHDLYWSPERRGGSEYGIALDALSLTASPARINPQPLTFRDGDAHIAAWKSTDSFERALLKRAAEAHRRRHGGPLVVHDDATQELVGLSVHDPRVREALDARSSGIEIRSAPQPLDVSQPLRQIELVVMPYEQVALVAHKGRMIEEVCDRNAFAGIERQANKIRVNRDHVRERTVGRAIRFHPHDPRGLLAEVRIAATPLGDETLALAEDDCLDCSAGFGVRAGGERWETRDRRRLTSLYLDHIALTPDPAYVDANVLAVRGTR